jgi:agmatine deiminase
MPPEWSAHAATWVTWPKEPETWGADLLEVVQHVYADIAMALAPAEPLHAIVHDAEVEARARAALEARGVPDGAVRFYRFPNNDAWTRDHGPIFVLRRTAAGRVERALVGFRFNAWGGKYPPWSLDAAIPGHIAATYREPFFEANLVLEGGSIDTNGEGVFLTTEQCLLNPNRNPHLDRAALEERLAAYLGARQVIWLGDGIVGDDTDGHVDDLARFADPRTILTVIEQDPADGNYAALKDNRERLAAARDEAGRPFRVLELPMPPALYGREGRRLPASYANFYIANGRVLMPSYDARTDARAAAVLGAAFPEHRIVPIRSQELVVGLGALHCITQQQPAI